MSDHLGDSQEQRQAEPLMLELLGATTGVALKPYRLLTPGRCKINLDGWSEDPLVLCEAWAHQGRAKPAQSAKVMKDALKLIFAERALGQPARKILLFACDQAASCFHTGWPGEALGAFGVELHVVDLAQETRVGLRKARTRQYR
jgi:hypothetical protein